MNDAQLQQLLSTGLNIGGTALGAYNQQQQYNGLQSALNTIGPTSLSGYSLSGPGGMSSGYNPSSGGGSIDLGSLNPAYSGFSGAAGMGANTYSPGLLSSLTGNAAGTLGASTNALSGAYGNYNTAMGAANTQLGALGQTYNQVYGNTLSSLQAQQQPQVQQQAFGLQNTLFGKGTLDSTGAASGAIAAGNFGSQVNAMNAQDSLSAQQQALSAQAAGVQNYGALSSAAGNVLSGAFNNFGNTNQLISGLNSAQLNNSLSAAQGAGALNTLGLNNYNAALGTGTAQATARNQSLFPYASTASALAGTPNAAGLLANGMTQAGGSLGGAVSGLGGFIGNLFSPSSGIPNTGNANGLNPGSANQQYASPLFNWQQGGSTSGDTTYYGDDGGFNPAGGEAATSQSSSPYSNFGGANFDAGSALATAGSGLGIVNGLRSGTPMGTAGAAASATSLYGKVAGNSTANAAGGIAADTLGIYSGLKQGGVAGYGQAAVDAGKLGISTGTISNSPALQGALGIVGAGLSTYNFVKDYQSGDTSGDAIRGAEAGASIGSIVPGVGTLIGGVIGGAVGALSSAFGSGKVDPENQSFEGYTQAYNKASPAQQAQVAASVSDPYTVLAGYFDLRSGQLKGSNPIYSTYGRAGEQKFTTDLTSQISSAIQSGKVSAKASPDTVYAQVVAPWVASMGNWQDSNKSAMQGLLQTMTAQYMNGSYSTQWKAVGGQDPFATASQTPTASGTSRAKM